MTTDGTTTERAVADRTVGLAFVPPAALGIGTFVAVVGVMGVAGFATALREAGWMGPAALFVALMAVGVASVAMGLGLPRVLSLVAAAAPSIIAALGALWGLSRMLNVLHLVDAQDRVTLFCAGYAESIAGRVVVGPVAAALFVGVALSALLRARRRVDERWSMLALAALALVGAGFAVASATVAASMHANLALLSIDANDQRAPLAALMESQAAFGRVIGLGIAALGGAVLLVVVALASARGGRIGGAGIFGCALALLVAPALDVAHEATALRGAHAGAQRPWRGISDFAPVVLGVGLSVHPDGAQDEPRHDVLIVTKDAVVLGHDRVMTMSSSKVTSQDVRGFVASIVSRSDALVEPGGAENTAEYATLRVAFDARASAELVAAVLGVARDANVEMVKLVGVASGGGAPGIVGRAAPTLERAVRLGCARAQADPRIGDVHDVNKLTCVDASNANAAEVVRRLPDVRAETVALALDAADARSVK